MTRASDKGRGGPTERPLRLRRSAEVRPLRLEPPIRLLAAGREPAPATFDGAELRRLREARGLTVRALADRTRLARQHIENLEAGRVERLPARPYLRGWLQAIAKELGLDPEQVSRSYLGAVLPPGDSGAPR